LFVFSTNIIIFRDLKIYIIKECYVLMKKRYWYQSWSHFFLWSHVVSIVGFYLILWKRTAPDRADRVKLPQTAASTSLPLVSIIVPARNEEANIRRCVSSLLEQDYDNFEVIVVDDGSTDHTAQVLDDIIASHPRADRLYVLRLRDKLPRGWVGKPHAIHRGTQEASGTWFLFTDADTWHAPNALRLTLAQALAEQADMFSIASVQELPAFWDKVLMPLAYMGISMLYPPRLVNNPLSPVAVANGQYILIKRFVYDALGGYARPDLKGTLLDDRDLARVVKELGYRLRFVDGQGLVRVHMYNNLDEIWRGWRKNAYLGNRGGILFFLLQLIGLPMVTMSPFLLPLLLFFTGRKRRSALSRAEIGTAIACEMAPLLAYRSWLNRSLGVPWYYAFTHPLGGAIFEGILAQSFWRILTRRGVDWRGREYHNGRK
jgi:chlorobactene glucosyltransferase